MTQDQDDLREHIPVATANCPTAVREALETALDVETQLRYAGDIRIDPVSDGDLKTALAQFNALMADGVLILILYLPEKASKLPHLFRHLLEAYAGLRILVISDPLTASSITVYWMRLHWSKLPVKDTDNLSGALLNGIRFVTTLDPSQEDNPSPSISETEF